MRFFLTSPLGPKRHKTPEGYLLVQDVPLARVGELIYGPGETPLKPGPEGIVRITRDAETVFRQETIDSIAGKPVTLGHPRTDVNPRNWRDLSAGIVLNPRRGVGQDADFMIGDVLIMDADAIARVEEKDPKRRLREVSCGYDAEYDEIAPGRGRQRDIIYNHLALVPAGRCGARCAFGDSRDGEPVTDRSMEMAKKSIVEKIRDAFVVNDQAALDEALEGVPAEGEDTHVHVHLGEAQTRDGEGETADSRLERLETMVADALGAVTTLTERMATLDARLTAAPAATADAAAAAATAASDKDAAELAARLEAEAPAGKGEDAKKARDSSFLADAHAETVSLAELLAPGIRVPTYDRAAEPKKTLDSICALRRRALDLAYVQPETRGALDDLLAGATLDTRNMTCEAARVLFRGVATAKKALNQAKARDGVGSAAKARGPQTIAEINKRNQEFYSQKNA